MKIGDSRILGGPGILPLQHEDYESGKWPLWNRASILAVRLTGRFDNEGGTTESPNQVGWWREDPETRGDVIGGQYWQRTTRELGAWRFAWPVRTSDEVDDSINPSSGSQSRPSGSSAAGGSIQAGTVGAGASPGFFGIQAGGAGAVGVTIINRPPVRNRPGGRDPDGKGNPDRPTTGTTTTDGKTGCSSLKTELMIPVRRGNWARDDRLTTMDYQRPRGASAFLWPKFPLDWFGISLQADHEDSQEDLFYPTDPRLVSVHCHGDEEMGSLVCEMGPGFKVDELKMARLQSAWKIAKKPAGCGIQSKNPSLTWNIGETGCKDSIGGLVWEVGQQATPGAPPESVARPSTSSAMAGGIGGTVARPSSSGGNGTVAGNGGGNRVPGTVVGSGSACPVGTYGHVSQKRSGFLELDCGNNHKIGDDGDGNPIFSAHLSLESYFVAPGGAFDGPLKHDGLVSGAPPAPFPVDVQFGFDPVIPHRFVCGDRRGRQRWRSGCFLYKPPTEPPEEPPPGPPEEPPPSAPPPTSPPQPPLTPTEELPPNPPRPPPEVTPFPGGEIPPFDPGGGTIFTPPSESLFPPLSPDDLFPGGILVGPPSDLVPIDELTGPPGPQRSFETVAPYTPSDGMLEFSATTMETAFPAILARPQLVATDAPAWKNIGAPSIPLLRATVDGYTPITGRIEAFGAQGQKTGATILDSSYLWDYTHWPDTYRYESGTADGGFVVLPPEVGIEDVDGGFAPPIEGAATSNTVMMVGPGARFGAGTPDLQRGGVNLGYTWRDDGGALKWATNYWSSGTDRICFDGTGKLGIGEMSPATDLHIKNSEASPINADFVTIESSGDSANDSFGIGFENGQGELAKIRCLQYGSGNAGRLQFQTSRLSTMFRWTVLDERGKWTFYDSLYSAQFSLDTTLDKFLTPAGTVADPVIASMADDNTGVYFPGADQMAVSTGGTMRAYWDRFGNFGVNTAVFGGGRGVIGVKNVITAPSLTPLGGGVLYVDAGALVFKGGSGTVTTIAVA